MVNKKKLKKQFKKKFQYGREVFGKHAYPKAMEVHDKIEQLVKNNHIGQEHALNWDLKGQVIDLVKKGLNVDIVPTTAKRWIDKISGIETSRIDEPVNWDSQAIIDAIGVSGQTQFTMTNAIMHQPRILRSTRWIDRHVEEGEGEIAPETFRYVKCANFVLNNMGSALALDIDLWVIAKAFERRDRLGLDNQDLIDWISYAPYMSEHYYRDYLNAIDKGSVKELSAFDKDVAVTIEYTVQEGDSPIEDIHMPDIEKQALRMALKEGAWAEKSGIEVPNLKFKARQTLADYLFGFAEAMDLKRYLLPSQTLSQYIQATKPKDLIKIELGSPAYVLMDLEEEVKFNSSVPTTVPKVSKDGDFVAVSDNTYGSHISSQLPLTIVA